MLIAGGLLLQILLEHTTMLDLTTVQTTVPLYAVACHPITALSEETSYMKEVLAIATMI